MKWTLAKLQLGYIQWLKMFCVNNKDILKYDVNHFGTGCTECILFIQIPKTECKKYCAVDRNCIPKCLKFCFVQNMRFCSDFTMWHKYFLTECMEKLWTHNVSISNGNIKSFLWKFSTKIDFPVGIIIISRHHCWCWHRKSKVPTYSMPYGMY